MLLRLPNNLHYPLTVKKIEKRVGEAIAQNEDLFLYSYTTKVKEGTRYEEEEREVDKTFVAHFDSTLDGIVKGWRVWSGDVITGPMDVCEVEEECLHTVQFQGMCTNCGKDMTLVQSGSQTTDADRAPIRMAHDTQFLTISQEEANRIDEESKRRLLASRKLSLVVDLDQTIIHAAVDPTIAEWQKDPDNPNYEAVKDVRAFQLVDDGPGMRGCWYYIKLRPGLERFLESVSRLYELHIYTMGTRQYAQQIAKIVDPDRKIFGERILSRDESGSMVAKNLERLFPVDTKMVVIIDDRGDVWKWSANLVRVTPFEFFVGIGDINSSFLPKKQEIAPTAIAETNDQSTKEAKQEPNGEEKTNGVAEDGTSTIQNGTSALEQLVAMGGGDDPAVREVQSKGQEEIISTQLEEKPLLKMQMEQDQKDAAAEGVANGETQASTESDSSDSSDSSNIAPTSSRLKPRHSILRNDDVELVHLEASLTGVHRAFFAEYDRRRLSGKGGRVGALSGKRKPQLPAEAEEAQHAADLLLVPDVKKVMPAMKLRALSGVTIVFSGVLPLGTDIQNADISTWAKTFGAQITEKVGRGVTHVIARRPGTAKVKQAVKRGIKVVSTAWLIDSMQQWRKLDERPYLLEGAGKRDETREPDAVESVHVTRHDYLLSSSDEEGETTGLDTETEVESEEGPKRKRLKVDTDKANSSTKLRKLRGVNDGPVGADAAARGGDGDDVYDFGDASPLTINQDEWDDIDAELKEFMGSDAENMSESDTESISSRLSVRGKKRKKGDSESDNETPPGEFGDGGRRPTASGSGPGSTAIGGSSLRQVKNVENMDSTPRREDEEVRTEQKLVEDKELKEEAEEEDSDDELARELERELEEADGGYE